MTSYITGSSAVSYVPPTWVRVLLGMILILGGVIVLGDVALATLVSALLIGFTAIAVGAFEIVHAFWTKGWGGFFWQILLGGLYIAFGLLVVNQPASGALVLTFVLGLMLLASGVVRIVMAIRNWRDMGWVMAISGLLGVLAGLIILMGWPISGLWALGLLLAVDLLSHGVAWLTYGWLPSAQST